MSHSEALFIQAQRSMPGGVNSPVRAFKNVGGFPRFIQSASGAYLTDVDGQKFVDYIGSWGSMILGHNDPDVIAALQTQLTQGVSFGTATENEIHLAELVAQLIPHIEMLRLVNSGTEATMSALRLARAVTHRNKVVKFIGCYHGHADAFLVDAGSGAATHGYPSSPGVPEAVVADTLSVPFNDKQAIIECFEQFDHEIAAVIIEPIAGNMNCIPPQPGFLKLLRNLCDNTNSLLIFDEVMTGFRVALGGAQSLYDVKPDLTTLGKIIGGGLPVGAFGGRETLMSQLSPCGPIYQAGTLSGNPLATIAGLTTLKKLQSTDPYPTLEKHTADLCTGLTSLANDAGIALSTVQVGSMFGLCFSNTCPQNFDDINNANTTLFNQFFHGMLERGVYFAPSAFEAGFISVCHDHDVIAKTLDAAKSVFESIASA